VKNGHCVADFGLVTVLPKAGVGSRYALFKASAFESAEKKNVFVAAFRNIGDGSGTLFVFLNWRADGYQVAAKYWTQEGRVKLLRSGKIQVWNADGGGECVWCPQHYEVTTYEWQHGELGRVGRFATKQALDPALIADDPIAFEE
jgi:hypothetical protein